jgi:EKC/KEOPS complex subunit PCC1/LAGE3
LRSNFTQNICLTLTSAITIPFPTAALAETALSALSIDAELSPLVQRSFSLTTPSSTSDTPGSKHVLQVDYSAATNRMLRVAVNGFLESLGVVVNVMRDLDVDVVERDMYGGEGLEGVQGLDVKG